MHFFPDCSLVSTQKVCEFGLVKKKKKNFSRANIELYGPRKKQAILPYLVSSSICS